MHGSLDGLQLASGEIVSWTAFTKAVREINKITKNNILLSLAACFGGYIMGTIIPSEPIPFFGFIGCWDEVHEGELIANFYNFFERIWGSGNLQAI
jgi:hypothetical protein